MKKKYSIADFMHSPVHTIGGEETLEHAKQLLYRLGVHHLPVLLAGKCIGILSDRDLKLAYAVEQSNAARLLVKNACVTTIYEVSPGEELAEVARCMAERHIGSAVVIDQGKICGIFTVTDACRALAALAKAS
jgi:acetoin utilization protein AcuB